MPPIEIYTTGFCPYCVAAKKLLKPARASPFKEISVAATAKSGRKMVERANGGYTVPQIFIGTTHVGGCDDLYALDQAGKLDPLLQPAQQGPTA